MRSSLVVSILILALLFNGCSEFKTWGSPPAQDSIEILNPKEDPRMVEFKEKYNQIMDSNRKLNELIIDWNINLGKIDDGTQLNEAIQINNKYYELCYKTATKIGHLADYITDQNWEYFKTQFSEQDFENLEKNIDLVGSCTETSRGMRETVQQWQYIKEKERLDQQELEILTGFLKVLI